MEVVIGHKGKCAYQVVVKGLACHSGQAPFGVNAVDYAAKLISYIAEIAKEKSIKGPFDLIMKFLTQHCILELYREEPS